MGHLVVGMIIGFMIAHFRIHEVIGAALIFGVFYPVVNFFGRILSRR